ncbi:GTPase [Actinomyces ruminicola]|uniref:GTPase n=1 Tax=Actinomyces ruminicola TaxID=332524 RepID=UPI0011CA8CF9|nr:GTPase [Actinomyces ruminicola]
MRTIRRTPPGRRRDAAAEPLAVLARLTQTGAGLLPADLLESAQTLLDRAGQRRLVAPGVQVVALLGATGSGKSSLFNALCGADLAQVAVTRPTTTQPLAALPASPSPEADGAAGRLLDWLEVRERVRLPQSPSWGPAAVGLGDGAVLLDLPDIDSDVRSHRAVAERLAGLVDVLVWVLDPEKYADAVIHNEFIAPMAEHASVSVVVLNQVDRLHEDERAAAVADLRRLLAAEGLHDVDVIPVSARTGQGVQELRARIRAVAAAEDVIEARLAADARALAALARERIGKQPERAHAADATTLTALEDAACRAVGVDLVADAVGTSMRLEAGHRVGWLPLRWLSYLRRDPLRALHLRPDSNDRGAVPSAAAPRTSLPAPSAADDAALRAAVHMYTTARIGRLPAVVQERVTGRLGAGTERIYDSLDAAVARTDLEQTCRRPRWWGAANAMQVLLALTALIGAGWLLMLHVLDRYLLLPVNPPRWGHVPWPTVLLLGGLLLGLLLAAVGAVMARVGAVRRTRRVRERLRHAVTEALNELLGTPLEQELARLEEVQALLDSLCESGRSAPGSGDAGVGSR